MFLIVVFKFDGFMHLNVQQKICSKKVGQIIWQLLIAFWKMCVKSKYFTRMVYANLKFVQENSAKSFDSLLINCFLNDVCEAEIFYENDICAFDSTINKWCERYVVKYLMFLWSRFNCAMMLFSNLMVFAYIQIKIKICHEKSAQSFDNCFSFF